MKRLALILVAALAAGILGGCRFAVVERESIRVGAFSALAEEAGEGNLPDGQDQPIGLYSRDEEGENVVRRLQQRLIDLGYLSVEADGVFGSQTLRALKRFQKDNGLKQTGMLDEETNGALFIVPAVTTAPEAVLLADGASGDAVDDVQTRLAQYGFSSRTATGEFDDVTGDAVMAFQAYAVENYGTEFDDPLPEPELLVETLIENDAPIPTPSPTPDPALQTEIPEMPALAPEATLRPHHATDGVVSENLYAYLIADRFPVYRKTVQRGDEGREVTRVQNRLTNLEYYYETVGGVFDDQTMEALKWFQAENGLQETGIADQETQEVLFSEDAVPAEQVEMPFYIKVSIDDQRVYVYRWQDGDYSRLIKTMICSTGFGNSTPRGVFVSPGHRDARWHYFAEFNCWAQYAFVIKGGILFHPVIYSRKDESSLRVSTLNNLGRKASHGCVRLKVEDAKWIYEHCGKGQVIEIY